MQEASDSDSDSDDGSRKSDSSSDSSDSSKTRFSSKNPMNLVTAAASFVGKVKPAIQYQYKTTI